MEVIQEKRLRWFGHVLRMDAEEGVKRALEKPGREKIKRGAENSMAG